MSTTTPRGHSTAGEIPVEEDTRGFTITVAASNSLDPTLAPAAYRCTGVNDEMEMNAALVAAAAVNGRVELLEGDYNTVLTLSVAVNVALVGNGWGSVINFNAGGNAITVAGDNVKIRDLKIVITAGAGAGGTRPNCILADTRTNLEVTKCWLVGDLTVANDGSDLRQCGIVFDTVTYSRIALCRSDDHMRNGIVLHSSSNNNTVTGNTCSGNTADGIVLHSASNNNTVTGNTCSGNTANGIVLHSSRDNTVTGNTCNGNPGGGITLTTSSDNTLTGNTCNGNTERGIFLYSASNNNTVTGNTCSGNTADGIVLHSSRDNTLTGNTCNENTQSGISLTVTSNNNTVTGNTCTENDSGNTGTYDGICIEDDSDYNLVMCNTCNDNDRWGISIGIVANDCVGTWVKNNHLRGNTSGPFFDGGTDTRLATKTFQFIQGTTFISDSAAAKGWSIIDVNHFAIALGQLPLEVQQVVRIKIWAVALGAPIGGGGQMHLDVLINGGVSGTAYTTETIGLTSFDGEEADYANTEVVHWVIDSGDDVDIDDLVGGMSMEYKVIYRAGDDPDGATNATFRTVEVEYV